MKAKKVDIDFLSIYLLARYQNRIWSTRMLLGTTVIFYSALCSLGCQAGHSLSEACIGNKFNGANDIYTKILQHHGLPKQVSEKLKK